MVLTRSWTPTAPPPVNLVVMRTKATVLELEIWSRPGEGNRWADGSAVALRCSAALQLPGETVFGLSIVPDLTDLENLESAIQAGEVSRDDFLEFCAKNSFETELVNPMSACRYLAHLYGAPLAWVHLPMNSEVDDLINRLTNWTREHGFALVDPDNLACMYAVVNDSSNRRGLA